MNISRTFAALFAGSLVLSSGPVRTVAAEPPPGFTAIFNGKDLTGWWGLEHFDPRKLTDEKRAEKHEANQADFTKHWRVENGELVNDGNGAFATSEKDYGDIEFMIDYKTVAQADSGVYLRANPQVQIWDYTK